MMTISQGESYFVLGDGRTLRPERLNEIVDLCRSMEMLPCCAFARILASEAHDLDANAGVADDVRRRAWEAARALGGAAPGSIALREVEAHLRAALLGRDLKGMAQLWHLAALAIEFRDGVPREKRLGSCLTALEVPSYLMEYPIELGEYNTTRIKELGGDVREADTHTWVPARGVAGSPIDTLAELRAVFREPRAATEFLSRTKDAATRSRDGSVIPAIPQAPRVGDDCEWFGGSMRLEHGEIAHFIMIMFRVQSTALRVVVGSTPECPPEKRMTIPKVRLIAERGRDLVLDPRARAQLGPRIDWPLLDPPPRLAPDPAVAGPDQVKCGRCGAVDATYHKYCPRCRALLAS